MTHPLIDEYTGKHLADFTWQDRQNHKRYTQGKVHAKQGRTDLLGVCPHYDAGFKAQSEQA